MKGINKSMAAMSLGVSTGRRYQLFLFIFFLLYFLLSFLLFYSFFLRQKKEAKTLGKSVLHLTAKEAFEIALKEAKSWQPDAKLVEINSTLREKGVRVDEGGRAVSGEGWAFIFYSKKSLEENTYYIEVKDRRVTRKEKGNQAPEEYFDIFSHSSISDWRLDSPEALKIALLNGGREVIAFDSQGRIFLSLRFFLTPQKKVSWAWQVVFSSLEREMSISIDASNGKVIGKTEIY